MAGRPPRRGRPGGCRGHVAHRPPGARLQGAARRTSPATSPSTPRSPRSCCARGSSPSARSGGSVATRAYAGSTSITTRSPRWRRPWSPRCTHDRTHAHQAPRTGQRLPRAVRRRRRRPPPPGAGAAAVPPHPRRGRRRAPRRFAGGRLRRPHGALQRRREPGRDERQRHPLLRPGGRRTAWRPGRPAHPHRRRTTHRRAGADGGPRTRSWPPWTWARSPTSPRRTAGPPSAPTPIGPSPTSGSATRTRSSASTTWRPSTSAVARRSGSRTSTSRSSSPAPSATPSRCASTSAAPASPRRAARAPRRRRGQPRGGVSSTPASTELLVHMDGGSAKVSLHRPAPGRVTLTGPATYIGSIEVPSA